MADWQITYRCNENCISCIIPEEVYGREVPEKITELFLHQNEDDVISIGGGEPTLHDDILDILQKAREENPGATIFLVTNGRMFAYEEFVQELSELELGDFRLGISLYGHEAEVHEKVTRVEGSFRDTVQGIKNLTAEGFEVEVRVVVHRLNHEHLPEIYSFVDEELPGISRLVFMNAKYSGRAYDNREELLVEYPEVVPYMEEALSLTEEENFPVRLFHFPLCTLDEEFRDYAATGNTKDSGAEEIGYASVCEECGRWEECSGIWQSYLNLVGEDEFEPIQDGES
ncbi:MAG: radical SAM protein [Candidatus Nanohaloarchaeota archaeon QJJ-7]|nr:radical SAM protein [Candidatus Nanohaloarchaeota archaeon QJJ-7]